MSTFLYSMINSFIMLTQRKFIWFYTYTQTHNMHNTKYILAHKYGQNTGSSASLCVCVCAYEASLSVFVSCRGNVPRSIKLEAGISYVEYERCIQYSIECSYASSIPGIIIIIIILTVRFSQLLLCCCAHADHFITFFWYDKF